MTAAEFLRSHLLREARERVLAECVERGATPHETSEALSKAHEKIAPYGATRERLRTSISVCEYVIENAWNYPAEQVAEMKRSAAWKRELLSMLNEEASR